VIDLDPTLDKELFDVAVERPNRRYQRTARTMISGGNRNPANAELGNTGVERQRRDLIPPPSPPARALRQCNSAPAMAGIQATNSGPARILDEAMFGDAELTQRRNVCARQSCGRARAATAPITRAD
jgi:hypothetical protein